MTIKPFNFNIYDRYEDITPDACVCPVCEKEYEHYNFLLSHIGPHSRKRECWKSVYSHSKIYKEMFINTPTEKLFLTTFNLIRGASYKEFRSLRIGQFRNMKAVYNSFCELFMFCYDNKIKLIDYLEFHLSKEKMTHIPIIFSYIQKERWLLDYYEHKRNTVTDEESEKWFLINKGEIYKFRIIINAFRHGKISPRYFFSQVDYDDYLENICEGAEKYSLQKYY